MEGYCVAATRRRKYSITLAAPTSALKKLPMDCAPLDFLNSSLADSSPVPRFVACRRLGRRCARSRRGRRDRRARADAALSLRHGARAGAARVGSDRGVRAAQWACRRQPAEAGVAGRAARNILRDEARKQLAIAADYIKTCGYHRRDEELAERSPYSTVKKIFAKLPAAGLSADPLPAR